MGKKDPANYDLGALGDALGKMQEAYEEGLEAVGKSGEQATENLEPTHRIDIDVKLSAKVESHPYLVDAHLEFLADLDSIMNAEGGDIGTVLEGLDVDLGEEESKQVAEQLGKPRCVAKLDKQEVKKLKLHSDKGEVKEGIDKNGTMLVTLEKEKLHLSFESVFALPKLAAKQTLFLAVPSTEQMQKHVVLDANKFGKKTPFEWMEKNKDNLKVQGVAKIMKLK